VALFTVIIATFLALVGSIYLSKKLFTSNVFGGLALSSTQEKSDGFTSAQSSYTSMINREGVARTVLRPAGKVLIDDEIFDATAESGFIDKDSAVRVTRYINAQLFVRKIS
jgi:membrane-bound serine protease (ClpP class)